MHEQKTARRIERGRKRRLTGMKTSLTRSFPEGKEGKRGTRRPDAFAQRLSLRNDKVLRKLSRARKSRARVALNESPRTRPISS